jgi:hypothetical protein
MAILTGKDGEVKFTNNNVARVRNFSVESSLNLLEVTNLGQRQTSTEAGLRSYTGSATIMYDSDDDQEITNILGRIFLGETAESLPAKITFKVSSGKTIAFDAFVTSANIGVSSGEITTADISFTAKNALTTANL